MQYSSAIGAYNVCDGFTTMEVQCIPGSDLLSEGLIAHLTLDETSGTTANDSTANNNDGTMSGGLDAGNDSVPGEIDTAINFDGSDDYIAMPSHDFGNEFTIAAWVNLDSPSNDLQTIASNSNSGATTDGFRFFINESMTSNGRVVFETANGVDDDSPLTSVGVVSAGSWHHVAVSVNRGAGTGIIYVDGADQSIYTGVQTDFNVNGVWRIGAMLDWAYTDGTIDDVRVYDRALGAAEVAALYNFTDGGATSGAVISATMSYHSCALKTNGTAWCWGDDFDGEIGNGAVTGDQISPVMVNIAGPIPDTWKMIGGGRDHICALGNNDTIWCWGYDGSGELGNAIDVYDNRESPDAIDVTGSIPDTWKTLAVGDGHNCAIGSDDTAWCWGHGWYGQIGNGANDMENISPLAVDVAGSIPDTWKQLSAGVQHTCGIGSDDTLWCWGRDNYGALGNGPPTGNIELSPIAVDVAGAIPDTWKAIDLGQSQNCAIAMNDTLWCWGVDSYGAVGDGGIEDSQESPVPVDVTGGIPDTWKAVSMGVWHTCGIGSDDTLWCWGYDDYGQIGNGGTTGDQTSPVAVDTTGSIPNTWKAVSAGYTHTCAIAMDDSVWCWGTDDYGEVGNGATTGQQNSPVAVFDSTNSDAPCQFAGACTKAGAMGVINGRLAVCDGTDWQVIAE